MPQYKREPKPTTPPREGYRWVMNIMSGKWIEEADGTPFFMSVGSETYWSS
jgi:hypothetical protein